MATILRPFRNYDEKDVINLFSLSGTIPATAGLLVKVVEGYKATNEPIEMLGSVGASYGNTVSQRYGAYAKVARAGAGEKAVGILLKDVKEVDENGEQLKFNPRKAGEMDVVISGQACPIVTKGQFLYSGTTLSAQEGVAMQKIYAAANGELSTGESGDAVGYLLGAKDSNNHLMINIDL